jgi:hypothetical protein
MSTFVSQVYDNISVKKSPKKWVLPFSKEQLQDKTWRLNHLYFIKNAEGKKIPFQMNWAQKELYEDPHPFKIILKARQLGITTWCCIDHLDDVLWSKNLQAGIILQTRDDAANAFKDKLKFAFDSLDPRIRQAFKITSDSSTELSFAHGSNIRVGTSLRSSTLQRLHISEYGKICSKYPEKALEVMTGALNTVHAGQRIVIESTAEGKEGFFHDLWQKAWSKKLSNEPLSVLEFKPHFFPWHKESSYSLGKRGGELL